MSNLVEHHTRWSGLESADDDAEVAVLGITFDSAVSWRGGTRHAPERIRSLMEGAAVMGMTLALHSAITFEQGAVLESNFHDYAMVRSNNFPEKVNVRDV